MNRTHLIKIIPIIVVVTIAVLLLSGRAIGETTTLRWMNDPSRYESVESTVRGDHIYIDLADFAEKMGLVYRVADNGKRIALDLPVHQLIFSSGNPFYLLDNQVFQMPHSLLATDGGIYIHIQSLLTVVAKHYPGDILYNPSVPELMVTPPRNDLFGAKIVVTKETTELIIPARKKIECKVTLNTEQNSVELLFPVAKIAIDDFPEQSDRKGYVLSAVAEKRDRGFRYTIKMDSGAVFNGLEFYDDPPLFAATFSGSDIVSSEYSDSDALQEDRRQWAMDVVVIDPGHGGKDPGAVGGKMLYEKTVTLDVGLRLRDALKKKGIQSVMTRDSDKFVSLGARTKLANRVGGKLFISLHCNAAKDRRAHGAETYFLSQTKTERAIKVAEMENSVIKFEEDRQEYHNLDDPNFILIAMAQAQFVQESQELAGQLQSFVPDKTGLKNRGIDQAGFYVLVGASMPAILFEMGFISNYKEEEQLRSPKFRQKMADNICEAVVKFLSENSSDTE